MRRFTMAMSVALMLIATLGRPIHAQPPRAVDQEEFSLWLVLVQHHHRSEIPAALREKLEAKEQSLQDASPADRARLERELKQERQSAEDARDHIIYGWSSTADEGGAQLSRGVSMSGFFLSANRENDAAIAQMRQRLDRQQPAVIAVNREGSKKLFTFSGRSWTQAVRAAHIDKPPDIMSPVAFPSPPKQAMEQRKRELVTLTLGSATSEPRDGGGERHRVLLRVECDQPPASASRVKVWIAITCSIAGESLGPILEEFEIPRSSSGRFSMSRSLEFITPAGVSMDADAMTVQTVGVDWP